MDQGGIFAKVDEDEGSLLQNRANRDAAENSSRENREISGSPPDTQYLHLSLQLYILKKWLNKPEPLRVLSFALCSGRILCCRCGG